MYSFVDIPIAGRVNYWSRKAVSIGGETRRHVFVRLSNSVGKTNETPIAALPGSDSSASGFAFSDRAIGLEFPADFAQIWFTDPNLAKVSRFAVFMRSFVATGSGRAGGSSSNESSGLQALSEFSLERARWSSEWIDSGLESITRWVVVGQHPIWTPCV